MSGGTISGNTANAAYYGGGGVLLRNGSFKKNPVASGSSSGIIYGSEASGNDANGVPLKNTATGTYYGAAICYYSSSSSRRNTTAGQTDYIDTSNSLGLNATGNPPF
jgi:hypothetical protein